MQEVRVDSYVSLDRYFRQLHADIGFGFELAYFSRTISIIKTKS